MSAVVSTLGTRWRDVTIGVVAIVVISLFLQHAGGDLWVADQLYRWQGGQWALRDHWLLSRVLHDGARQASAGMWLAMAAVWLISRHRGDCRAWHRPLGYLLLSCLAAVLLVAAIKRVSGVYCPWDLVRYGGDHAYVAPFSMSPHAAVGGGCFPAGHASAGYAWLAAPMMFGLEHPAWRFWLLSGVLCAGVVLGVTQQIRGAHFLSHDLWTLALCWLVASVLARVCFSSGARDDSARMACA